MEWRPTPPIAIVWLTNLNFAAVSNRRIEPIEALIAGALSSPFHSFFPISSSSSPSLTPSPTTCYADKWRPLRCTEGLWQRLTSVCYNKGSARFIITKTQLRFSKRWKTWTLAKMLQVSHAVLFSSSKVCFVFEILYNFMQKKTFSQWSTFFLKNEEQPSKENFRAMFLR